MKILSPLVYSTLRFPVVPPTYIVSMTDMWEVTFDHGITEDGSSGSPLFNSNDIS